MTANLNLNAAGTAEDDEFYTPMEDIADFIPSLETFLKGKSVYCNCDDWRTSKFYEYFKARFNGIGLKELTATGYKCGGMRFDGEKETELEIAGDGDFKSPECADIAKKSGAVVTNPPFSLFREYWEMMEAFKKNFNVDFVIVGHLAAVTYVKSLHAIMNRVIMAGPYLKGEYARPDGSVEKLCNTLWYTTLPIPPMRLAMEERDLARYERYDDADAIDVPALKLLPSNCGGTMGVPISYAQYHDPRLFDILACGSYSLNGAKTFKRFLIRRKKEKNEFEME